MDIQSYHKTLAEQYTKALDLVFVRNLQSNYEQISYCYDTDLVHYRTVAKKSKINFYFFCPDLAKIWKYVQQHLSKRHYNNFIIQLIHQKGQDALLITLDDKIFNYFVQNFKPRKQTGILTGNSKFKAVFQLLSKKIASIKRHFYGSIYEMLLQAIQSNHKGGSIKMNNISFKTNINEKVWIAFDRTNNIMIDKQFTVYFGIEYKDRFEQQLARIYFSELAQSRKHVQNSPNIAVTQSELPKFLVDSFPEQRNSKYSFSNGIVSLTFHGSLVHEIQTISSMLSRFKNYSYYHIQASKCYLHSRVLRRISTFTRDLTMAKIQPFE